MDEDSVAQTRQNRQPLTGKTDEEIREAALSDPDNPPLTDEDLAQFHPVPDVKAIRGSLGMNQAQFADTFGLTLSSLRDWEQRRFVPDQAARTLLLVIEHDPDTIIRALGGLPMERVGVVDIAQTTTSPPPEPVEELFDTAFENRAEEDGVLSARSSR